MQSQFDENRNKEHLSDSDLKAYLEGKMDAKNMLRFEYGVSEDAFKSEALEGYENHPEAIDDLNELKNEFHSKLASRPTGSWHRYSIYLSAAAVVIALLSSIALFYFLQPNAESISQKLSPQKEEISPVQKENKPPSPTLADPMKNNFSDRNKREKESEPTIEPNAETIVEKAIKEKAPVPNLVEEVPEIEKSIPIKSLKKELNESEESEMDNAKSSKTGSFVQNEIPAIQLDKEK